MLSPKQMAEMEAAFAAARDTYPGFWWGMYSNLKSEGFTEDQSMDLLKHYITATHINLGGKPNGPEKF